MTAPALPLPSRLPSGRTPLRARLLALVLFLAAGILALPALAQTFPALTGRVVDTAGLLDAPTATALDGQLAAFERSSSDQVVVATVPDLQGQAIEEYGVALARHWQLGQAGENNGVLLLVSRDDRKVRIEVGYGLEGTLTDALTQVIIQEDILPAFRAGDYPGGIRKGVDGILKVLSGDAAALQDRADRHAEADMPTETALFIGLFVLVWILVLGVGVIASLARVFGRKVGPKRWRWLGTTWAAGSAGGFSTGSSSFGGHSSSSGGGGFSGGGGSFGGGGSSGSW